MLFPFRSVRIGPWLSDAVLPNRRALDQAQLIVRPYTADRRLWTGRRSTDGLRPFTGTASSAGSEPLQAGTERHSCSLFALWVRSIIRRAPPQSSRRLNPQKAITCDRFQHEAENPSRRSAPPAHNEQVGESSEIQNVVVTTRLRARRTAVPPSRTERVLSFPRGFACRMPLLRPIWRISCTDLPVQPFMVVPADSPGGPQPHR